MFKRPHLGSLHFLTLNSSGFLLVNFAFVSKRFKFGHLTFAFNEYFVFKDFVQVIISV